MVEPTRPPLPASPGNSEDILMDPQLISSDSVVDEDEDGVREPPPSPQVSEDQIRMPLGNRELPSDSLIHHTPVPAFEEDTEYGFINWSSIGPYELDAACILQSLAANSARRRQEQRAAEASSTAVSLSITQPVATFPQQNISNLIIESTRPAVSEFQMIPTQSHLTAVLEVLPPTAFDNARTLAQSIVAAPTSQSYNHERDYAVASTSTTTVNGEKPIVESRRSRKMPRDKCRRIIRKTTLERNIGRKYSDITISKTTPLHIMRPEWRPNFRFIAPRSSSHAQQYQPVPNFRFIAPRSSSHAQQYQPVPNFRFIAPRSSSHAQQYQPVPNFRFIAPRSSSHAQQYQPVPTNLNNGSRSSTTHRYNNTNIPTSQSVSTNLTTSLSTSTTHSYNNTNIPILLSGSTNLTDGFSSSTTQTNVTTNVANPQLSNPPNAHFTIPRITDPPQTEAMSLVKHNGHKHTQNK